jgi:hypothetical protein
MLVHVNGRKRIAALATALRRAHRRRPVLAVGVAPHFDLRGVDVRMTAPLGPSIGGMVSHQTCARF